MIKNILILLLSIAVFSSWGIISKIYTYPVFELLFVIHFAGVFVGLFHSVKNKNKRKELLKIKKTTFFIAITLISDIFFLVLAYRSTNMATAITLHYLAPLLVPLFAILFLKEKINLKQYIPIALLGLAGTILISINTITVNPLGLFYGIMSGITLGLIIVLQKKNASSTYISVLVFQYSLIQSLTDLILGLIFNQIHLALTFGFISLFLFGLIIRHGTLLYNYVLKHLDISTASILAYTEVGLSVLYGFVLFHQKIFLAEIIGIILIILAGILIVMRKIDKEEITENI